MKIAIIGISASGKSVFARKLANKTKLPLYYMDQLFWKGKWEAVPEEEYLKSHEELIKKENWIIEGYIEPRMANRLKLADKIIYLDFSGLRCVWRLIKRHFMHRKESRPELPKEAVEGALDLKFLWTILLRKERPDIENSLEGIDVKKITRVSSPAELEKEF